MRHFIYTYSEAQKPLRNGHCHRTVVIYTVKRNVPVYLIERTDTFVSEFQLVMDALEEVKALPRKAFAKHSNGSRINGSNFSLEEAGYARVTRVTSGTS